MASASDRWFPLADYDGRPGARFVHLLGICPVLAGGVTFANGLGLGLATMVVLVASGLLVSATRGWWPAPGRLPGLLLVMATLVALIALLGQAFWYERYMALGAFLPLVAINFTTLGRLAACASRVDVVSALADALAWGAAMAALLAVIGGLRELLAPTLVLAATPAGAFLTLALLVAGVNRVAARPRVASVNPVA